jgi:hypothetical protein
MRTYLVYRKEDADFGETVARELLKKQWEVVEDPAAADVAVLLVSRDALAKGLGAHPRRAMEAGLKILTLLLGDDAVPMRFPVHRKHVALVKDVAGVLKALGEHRRNMGAQRVDSKSDLFGYGLLLSLVHREG